MCTFIVRMLKSDPFSEEIPVSKVCFKSRGVVFKTNQSIATLQYFVSSFFCDMQKYLLVEEKQKTTVNFDRKAATREGKFSRT